MASFQYNFEWDAAKAAANLRKHGVRACPEIGFVAASLLAVAPEVIGFPKAASRLAATINR